MAKKQPRFSFISCRRSIVREDRFYVGIHFRSLQSRGYEQIRTAIALPGLRVRIAAAHDSKEQAQSGALNQMIEDLALMRVMPI
jgi:Transketolase, C-terminal subunit